MEVWQLWRGVHWPANHEDSLGNPPHLPPAPWGPADWAPATTCRPAKGASQVFDMQRRVCHGAGACQSQQNPCSTCWWGFNCFLTTATTTTTKLKLSIAKVTSVKCDQCESSFSSKTALTRHQSVHQERPFRCGHATCSESYRTVKIYSITAQSRQDNNFYIDKGGPFLQLLILD